VAAITGYGATIQEGFDVPYRLARLALIPEKQFRTDVVEILDTDYARFNRLLQIHKRDNPEVGGNK
jgi:hypothetical protein